MTDHAPEHLGTNGWQRFWNRGGWWRALLAAAVYLALYEGISYLLGVLLSGSIDGENLLNSPLSIFFAIALPILIMGLITFGFIASLGWQKEIFGRQPTTRRWWMWIAVVIVLVPNILRLAATNWSAYSVAAVLSLLFAGLCIGFAEELITRGVAVNLLRRGGHGERVVFVLSSVIFGILHGINLVTGQPLLTVGVTVLYAMGFGAMMYLSMRATGSIVPAMLLHASTDPTTFLASGGIDAQGDTAGAAGLIGIAGIFNVLYFVLALIAVILIKNEVVFKRAPAVDEPAA